MDRSAARPPFNVSSWLESYRVGHERCPTFLLVELDEPLRAGEWVSTTALPSPDHVHLAISRLGREPTPEEVGYAFPLRLINERLTDETAAQLDTALAIVNQLQGIDAREGLAFMTQLLLSTADMRRAMDDKPSTLATWGQAESGTLVKYNQLPARSQRPAFRLNRLLRFFHAGGGRVARGFVTSPTGEPGRAWYHAIPPRWLTPAELASVYGDGVTPARVSMLVDPVYVPLAERFLAAHQELDRELVRSRPPLLRLGDDDAVSAAPPENTLRRSGGKVWEIAYDGTTIHLEHSKGLEYLACLLREPGRSFPAGGLVTAVERQGNPAASPYRGMSAAQLGDHQLRRTSGLGDAGEVLDEQAKAEYKERLLNLEEELEEAQARGDDEQADKFAEEREFLLHELKAATGLGGRDRTAGSASERARINITKQIKAAMDKIAAQSPDLGRHLRAAIRTGNYCSYTPEPPIRWRC